MHKIVIFGGGSGLSQLLKGIEQFPWDVTAVVSVSDNGGSTGALRREHSIPAVGDITKVMMAMSASSKGVKDLLMYRFPQGSGLANHSVKNIIMTALLEMHGTFHESIPILSDLFDIRGNLYAVTEDNADLVGITADGREIVGEAQITQARSLVKELRYDKPVKANKDVIAAIEQADMIVLSSGSLLTSIAPHIIIPEVSEAIRKSNAKTVYICNLITQPGETDGFSVSRHIEELERYLGEGAVDAVIANCSDIPEDEKLLAQSEGKAAVSVDREKILQKGINLIEDSILTIEDGRIRHDTLKTAYLLFAYLMNQNM